MNSDIKQRVKQLLEDKCTNVNALSKSIGISQTTLNEQINGSGKVSLLVVSALLDLYPEVSAEWLLRGDGEMIKGSDTACVIDNERTCAREDADMIRRQQREIDGLYDRIEELKKDIARLQTSATTTTATIA